VGRSRVFDQLVDTAALAIYEAKIGRVEEIEKLDGAFLDEADGPQLDRPADRVFLRRQVAQNAGSGTGRLELVGSTYRPKLLRLSRGSLGSVA